MIKTFIEKSEGGLKIEELEDDESERSINDGQIRKSDPSAEFDPFYAPVYTEIVNQNNYPL